MEKYIYEKNNGLWYERRGDYYFPCLTAEEASPVGVWGQRHMRYITQNRRARYLELKTTGKDGETIYFVHYYGNTIAFPADACEEVEDG